MRITISNYHPLPINGKLPVSALLTLNHREASFRETSHCHCAVFVLFEGSMDLKEWGKVLYRMLISGRVWLIFVEMMFVDNVDTSVCQYNTY